MTDDPTLTGRTIAQAEAERGPQPQHGSSARLPGAYFQAMAALYLEHTPSATREGLARRLAQHLCRRGVRYHVRTLRRQILGSVATVPPEVEDGLRWLLREDLAIEGEEAIDRALAERGLEVPDTSRIPAQVEVGRVTSLMQLWLHYNRSRSKRHLARRLADDLRETGIHLNVDALQCRLAGRGQMVRREILERLLHYLEAHGIHSEAEARARLRALQDEVESTMTGRSFMPAHRFRQLCRLWQIREREGSSRRLAQRLQERLQAQGVEVGIDHLQRTIAGKTRRVRVEIHRTLEALVVEGYDSAAEMERALDIAQSKSPRNINLAWVRCEPIAELARDWLAATPGVSMRQLAIRVASTVRRMGYRTSHNSIQPILGGWKKKTRGYVYRAMLKQFPDDRTAQIPSEHIVGAIPGVEPSQDDKASDHPEHPTGERLAAYVREVRAHLPQAKSEHFARLAAMRAEGIFGTPWVDVYERIVSGARSDGSGDSSMNPSSSTSSRER